MRSLFTLLLLTIEFIKGSPEFGKRTYLPWSIDLVGLLFIGSIAIHLIVVGSGLHFLMKGPIGNF